jgi:uncharacterized protein YcbK (DUF882 family)
MRRAEFAKRVVEAGRWLERRAARFAGAVALGAGCGALFAATLSHEPRVEHGQGLAERKRDPRDRREQRGERDAQAPMDPSPLLATLVDTHSAERVPLDHAAPPQAHFDALVRDRVTGSSTPLDPRLLDLLRTLAAGYDSVDGGAPRIELVSGFRSPKLNEMLRKKGHHVASHSQHSLGHAVDFRLVAPCAAEGVAREEACDGGAAVALDPRTVERRIRAAGWDGGVGVYTSKDDWFVHADVGPERSWFEGPRTPERGEARP